MGQKCKETALSFASPLAVWDFSRLVHYCRLFKYSHTALQVFHLIIAQCLLSNGDKLLLAGNFNLFQAIFLLTDVNKNTSYISRFNIELSKDINLELFLQVGLCCANTDLQFLSTTDGK